MKFHSGSQKGIPETFVYKRNFTSDKDTGFTFHSVRHDKTATLQRSYHGVTLRPE